MIFGFVMRAKCYLFAVIVAILGFASARGAGPIQQSLSIPWDLTGVIGTGQSLSVGARADRHPATQPTGQNLQLSTDSLPWPIDPDDPHLRLVPLTEPIGRFAKGFPSSWPENIDGETWHGAMAAQLSALVHAATGHDLVSVQGEFGEDGQGVVFLKKNAIPKGLNGRSHAAAMIWTRAVTRLAKSSGRTFGVGAVVLTHGESDAGNPNYESEIHQLWADYNDDVKAITGQTQNVQLILSQQDSVWPGSTIAQWKLGADYPADIVCSGPKYQYPYASDSVHLTNRGYEQLGEKYAQVYFERVLCGRPWQPLGPTGIRRQGAVITVTYHAPVGPMVWETSFESPHPSVPQWKLGRGFEVTASDGAKVMISSVVIDGNTVVITCGADPGPNVRVSYATVGENTAMATPFHGTKRWGLLRDSDPFKGVVTGKPQPNYGVAFELTAP